MTLIWTVVPDIMFSQCTGTFVSEPVTDLVDGQSCVPGQLFLLLLAGVRTGPVPLKPPFKDGCESVSEVTWIVIYTALVGSIRTGGGDRSSRTANLSYTSLSVNESLSWLFQIVTLIVIFDQQVIKVSKKCIVCVPMFEILSQLVK